jgi:tRNA threonylcarbamoyladenosine biosynthesis protein TsaE
MALRYTHKDIDSVAKTQVMPLLDRYRIITFQGPLGAGKTTLIKELLRACGVTQTVTSPSFGYVNTYQGDNGRVFHHFDLYRIGSIDGFIGSGFDELLYQDRAICLIEWPEVIASLLSNNPLRPQVCDIAIGYALDDMAARTIEIKPR